MKFIEVTETIGTKLLINLACVSAIEDNDNTTLIKLSDISKPIRTFETYDSLKQRLSIFMDIG